jgi:hypothetical protein
VSFEQCFFLQGLFYFLALFLEHIDIVGRDPKTKLLKIFIRKYYKKTSKILDHTKNRRSPKDRDYIKLRRTKEKNKKISKKIYSQTQTKRRKIQ